MREIKFRAWDKYNHCFLHFDLSDISDIPEGGGHCHPGFATPDGEIDGFSIVDASTKQEGLIIQQYTGLKDKAGREIYEGDIVKARHEGIKLLKIVFVNGGFVDIPIDGEVENYSSLLIPDNSLLRDCEVIGNIYENPELLDK